MNFRCKLWDKFFLYMLHDKNKHHYNDLIEHSSLWWSELKEQQQQFQEESICACFIYIRDYILNIFIFVNILLMSNATEVKAQWIESVDFVFIKKKKNARTCWYSEKMQITSEIDFTKVLTVITHQSRSKKWMCVTSPFKLQDCVCVYF